MARLPQRRYTSAKSFFADLFVSLEESLERVHYNDLLKTLPTTAICVLSIRR
ncbi:hypothetical protein LPE509_03079 [Legionella pneumophila subsp. pneumophila LPE509]|nr:hypothetical protein LPE509_03079 [Legionella pneumophila subsp. pneumophila LPE509]